VTANRGFNRQSSVRAVEDRSAEEAPGESTCRSAWAACATECFDLLHSEVTVCVCVVGGAKVKAQRCTLAEQPGPGYTHL
jgi:hypothetical protein